MLAESLLYAPAVLSVDLHSQKRMLSYQTMVSHRLHNFGTMLEPRWIVGTGFLDQ